MTNSPIDKKLIPTFDPIRIAVYILQLQHFSSTKRFRERQARTAELVGRIAFYILDEALLIRMGTGICIHPPRNMDSVAKILVRCS
jgi:hypothetical protein